MFQADSPCKVPMEFGETCQWYLVRAGTEFAVHDYGSGQSRVATNARTRTGSLKQNSLTMATATTGINGVPRNYMKIILTPVLYCPQQKLWKLTDFGISAQATSKRPRSTEMAKGTSNYRAPELLSEQPTFTNKVDIWVL